MDAICDMATSASTQRAAPSIVPPGQSRRQRLALATSGYHQLNPRRRLLRAGLHLQRSGANASTSVHATAQRTTGHGAPRRSAPRLAQPQAQNGRSHHLKRHSSTGRAFSLHSHSWDGTGGRHGGGNRSWYRCASMRTRTGSVRPASSGRSRGTGLTAHASRHPLHSRAHVAPTGCAAVASSRAAARSVRHSRGTPLVALGLGSGAGGGAGTSAGFLEV
jgi:hypothetical protein